jgi:hypothetical protein
VSIREYNFAVPGLVDRHIPGIPGVWPAGSRVQVDEDTMQVVKVMMGPADGLQLVISGPMEVREYTGFDANGNAVNDSMAVPAAPPAGENSAVQQLSEAMKNF